MEVQPIAPQFAMYMYLQPFLSRILTRSEPELYADYRSIIYVPSIITDSAPQPTVTDLNTALSIISPSHQSHISVSTVYQWREESSNMSF